MHAVGNKRRPPDNDMIRQILQNTSISSDSKNSLEYGTLLKQTKKYRNVDEHSLKLSAGVTHQGIVAASKVSADASEENEREGLWPPRHAHNMFN